MTPFMAGGGGISGIAPALLGLLIPIFLGLLLGCTLFPFEPFLSAIPSLLFLNLG